LNFKRFLESKKEIMRERINKINEQVVNLEFQNLTPWNPGGNTISLCAGCRITFVPLKIGDVNESY
jgi:hypothetical protein